MRTDLQTPNHAVLLSDDRFELRAYEPYVVAATVVPGDFDQASRDGFRIIAGYIFGGNEPERTIAMTAPVQTEPVLPGVGSDEVSGRLQTIEDAAGWRVTFMMPREYTLQTLPAPSDRRVVLEEVPAKCVASVRFSGFTTVARVDQETSALRAWLRAKEVAEKGTALVARYDDPFTLPWRRHNEILVDVDAARCASVAPAAQGRGAVARASP